MEKVEIIKKDGQKKEVSDIHFSEKEIKEFKEHFNASEKNQKEGVKIKSRKKRSFKK